MCSSAVLLTAHNRTTLRRTDVGKSPNSCCVNAFINGGISAPNYRQTDGSERSVLAFSSDATSPALRISQPVFPSLGLIIWPRLKYLSHLNGLDGLYVCLGPRWWSASSVASLLEVISRSSIPFSYTQHTVWIWFALMFWRKCTCKLCNRFRRVQEKVKVERKVWDTAPFPGDKSSSCVCYSTETKWIWARIRSLLMWQTTNGSSWIMRLKPRTWGVFR